MCGMGSECLTSHLSTLNMIFTLSKPFLYGKWLDQLKLYLSLGIIIGEILWKETEREWSA